MLQIHFFFFNLLCTHGRSLCLVQWPCFWGYSYLVPTISPSPGWGRVHPRKFNPLRFTVGLPFAGYGITHKEGFQKETLWQTHLASPLKQITQKLSRPWVYGFPQFHVNATMVSSSGMQNQGEIIRIRQSLFFTMRQKTVRIHEVLLNTLFTLPNSLIPLSAAQKAGRKPAARSPRPRRTGVQRDPSAAGLHQRPCRRSFHLPWQPSFIWRLVFPNPGCTLESPGEFKRSRGLGPTTRNSYVIGLGYGRGILSCRPDLEIP